MIKHIQYFFFRIGYVIFLNTFSDKDFKSLGELKLGEIITTPTWKNKYKYVGNKKFISISRLKQIS